MATRATMKIRPGLIWEAQNPIPYRVNQSPEFVLLNSIWKLEIDLLSGRNRETNDMMFNINLRNLCVLQPFQAFEVTTFLEDKKSNSQMKCSKVIVASKDVTLYKASFFSLCKKLPGFNISNDLTILFVFTSSADLGLNVIKHEVPPKLCIVPCLIWETRKPLMHQTIKSNVFGLLSSSWKLEIILANSKVAFHSAYQVSLKNTNSSVSLPEFDVKMFLEHRDLSIQYKFSKLDDASSSSETAFKARFDSIFADVAGLGNVYDISVVCIFRPPTGLGLSMEAKNNMAVLLNCFRCQNRGCFIQDYVPPDPSSNRCPSMKFSPNYASLSEDLGKLVDDTFMSDIRLKCGDLLIPAHKTILAARSEVFSKKIVNEINVNRNNIVDVSDIEPVMFGIFIKYLYSGAISDVLSEEMVYKLYIISYSYAVTSLQSMCRCYMSRNLNERNFIDFLMVAHAHDDDDLKNAVALFIMRDSALMKNESWVRFAKEFPKIADEIHNKYITKTLTR